MLRYLQYFVIIILFTACESTSEPNYEANCIESKVFFGLSRTDGMISETDWNNFLDSEIVSRFPDGFTILNSDGYWKYCDTCPTQNEPSKVLILIYPISRFDENSVLIEQISEKYKQRFSQQFVLVSSAETNCNLK